MEAQQRVPWTSAAASARLCHGDARGRRTTMAAITFPRSLPKASALALLAVALGAAACARKGEPERSTRKAEARSSASGVSAPSAASAETKASEPAAVRPASVPRLRCAAKASGKAKVKLYMAAKRYARPEALAVSTEYVYVALDEAVWRIPKDGSGSAEVLTQLSNPHARLHADDTGVYVGTPERLVHVGRDKAVQTVRETPHGLKHMDLAQRYYEPDLGFQAMVSDGDHLWAELVDTEHHQSRIVRLPRSGGDFEVVLSAKYRPRYEELPMPGGIGSLAQDQEWIYATDTVDRRIVRIRKTDQEVQTLYETRTAPRPILLALDGERLYFNTLPPGVFGMPKSGGTPERLLPRLKIQDALPFHVDEGHLFVVIGPGYDPADNRSGPSSLVRIDTSTGATRSLLGSGQDDYMHILDFDDECAYVAVESSPTVVFAVSLT
jgi:hypothetical protein